jgi:hypothetical protein
VVQYGYEREGKIMEKTRMQWKLDRIGKNISLTELSVVVGVSTSMLSMFEKGVNMKDFRVKKYQEYIEKH